MFFIYQRSSIYVWIILVCINFLTVTVVQASSPRFNEHELLQNYFRTPDDSLQIEEMIEFIVSIKKQLISKHIEVPKLSSLFDSVKDHFFDNDSTCAIEEWKVFIEMLDEKELGITHIGFKKISHNSEKKISWKLVWAGCQLLAGGLCTVIPHPVAHLIAGSLILGGIASLEAEIGRFDEINRREQEKYGPPHLPPHFPREYFEREQSLQ